MYMHIILELLAQVRETGTVIRTDGVDGAFVVIQVEELAGSPFIHPVTLSSPLLFEVFFLEFGNGHVEMSRDPLEVFGIIGRRHGLAAIGAGQAVRFLPDFFFQ